MQNQAANQMSHYRRTEIESASPAKLLLMLYDGAITRLDKARRSIARSEVAGAHDHLVRAQDIILELMVSLNWDVGGEIPARLHSLYDFMYRRLVDANLKKEVEPIDEVLPILEQLRETWAQAVEQQQAAANGKAAPEAGQPQPQQPQSPASAAAGGEQAGPPARQPNNAYGQAAPKAPPRVSSLNVQG